MRRISCRTQAYHLTDKMDRLAFERTEYLYHESITRTKKLKEIINMAYIQGLIDGMDTARSESCATSKGD